LFSLGQKLFPRRKEENCSDAWAKTKARSGEALLANVGATWL